MFTFVDLFAGIGGFHALMSKVYGGRLVAASEIDEPARRVYEANWGIAPLGDIRSLTEPQVTLPAHEVLTAGFPCQPFSKSGKQLGVEDARGTLFFSVLQAVRHHKPKLLVLENVRNLAGPKHTDTYSNIITLLRQQGYKVSSRPLIISPHQLSASVGGRPQHRERVFILATHVGRPSDAWGLSTEEPAVPELEPVTWDVYAAQFGTGENARNVIDQLNVAPAGADTGLTAAEVDAIAIWEDFQASVRREAPTALNGFPVWLESLFPDGDNHADSSMPPWKVKLHLKNVRLYESHASVIEAWRSRNPHIASLPASKRKFEWQAGDADSLRDALLQFRPSGLRVKRPTHLPALVALTQTSILGGAMRRLSVREAARLQGLPDWFDFGDQSAAQSFKQLGNGINIGATHAAIQAHVRRDRELLPESIVNAILAAPRNPDEALHAPRRSYADGSASAA